MCGIFGLFSYSNKDNYFDENLISKTIDDLNHRGPDGNGQYIGDNTVLIHTRLSFLDLSSAGSQPMWDHSHRFCLVYNGEIYNYNDLRSSLMNQGCKFASSSDTEVLLQGLIIEGKEFVRKLQGMFAFALYDDVEKRLLLGRDRYGIKPLNYINNENKFVFCSEIRPLRHWHKFRENPYTVAAFINGAEPPTQGGTYINEVITAPAGCLIEVSYEGVTEPEPFFKIYDFVKNRELPEPRQYNTAEAAVNALDELLQQSVSDHMISDVPVGALCSGGLDSSLIMALASRNHNDLAIFHADVVGRHSERMAAEDLSRHLNLDLVSVEIDDEKYLDLIAETLLYYEYPFTYHPNSVPFLAVSKLVKENGIKAILSGEGADECFLGYSSIPTRSMILRYHKIIDSMGGLIGSIPVLGKIISRPRQHASFLNSIASGFETSIENQEISEFNSMSGLGSTRTQKLLGSHLRTLLHRNDRLGMAASIEARFPYLDNRVVEFAANLPDKFKVHLSWSAADERRHPFVFTKWILRKVGERYIPPHLANRRKRGFPTSVFERMVVKNEYLKHSWLRNTLSLSNKQINYMISNISSRNSIRLYLLDCWARIHVLDENISEIRDDIKQHLVIRPE